MEDQALERQALAARRERRDRPARVRDVEREGIRGEEIGQDAPFVRGHGLHAAVEEIGRGIREARRGPYGELVEARERLGFALHLEQLAARRATVGAERDQQNGVVLERAAAVAAGP